MSDFDNLFEPGNPGTAETQAEPRNEVPQPEVAPQQEPQEGVPAAPTQEDQDKHVPLAALEAERKGRQDWKEKAIRYEEELKALRAQQQQQPPQYQEHQQLDPMQQLQQQVINERFNTSEMLVKQAHPDAEEKVQVFMEAARANPALAAALQTQRHPWEFAYKEGQRLLMLKEVGDDPVQYREKVKAQLKAELMAEMQQSQPRQVPNLPQSLNGARSIGPRSMPAGPTEVPFDQLFRN